MKKQIFSKRGTYKNYCDDKRGKIEQKIERDCIRKKLLLYHDYTRENMRE